MKYIVDSMLGTLLKVLRILGYDAVSALPGASLSHIVEARNQNRILVTRNRRLRNHDGVFFVESEIVEAQVRALLERFPAGTEVKPFSRCLVCNGELEKKNPVEVADRIPFFIRKTQTDFSRCPDCGRVYWPGSHRRAMGRALRAIADVSRETPKRGKKKGVRS